MLYIRESTLYVFMIMAYLVGTILLVLKEIGKVVIEKDFVKHQLVLVNLRQ